VAEQSPQTTTEDNSRRPVPPRRANGIANIPPNATADVTG